MKKTILAVTVVAIVAVLGFALTRSEQPYFPSSSPSPTEITQPSTQPQTTMSFEAEGEQTAFELLQSKAVIEFDEFDAGVFVTSINGLKSDNAHYWAFYLNDEYAQRGVDQTTLKKGDVIKFVYEDIRL